LVGGLAAIVALSRWHAAELERRWRAVAESLGGTLTFKAGFDVTCSLAVSVNGHEITVTQGRKHQVYARGVLQHPPGFELRVYPRPPTWLVDQARSVTTGDPSFDTIFATEATDVDLAKTWLDPDVREAISRAGHVWLHVTDGRIVGNRAVFEFESDGIERLVRALGAVVGKANGNVVTQ
jgi:hypothetical protein